MILTIGKYKGQDISSIPLNYLKWMQRELKMEPSLRLAVETRLQELKSDKSNRVKIEKEIVNLPKNYHPISQIKIPTVRLPENNLTIKLAIELDKLGINFLADYKYERCRFDLVVYQGDTLLVIIEVKSKTFRNINKIKQGKQYYKYIQYGIPVIYCCHPTQIPTAVSEIKQVIDLHNLPH
jgi:hypothetical protein